MSETKPPWSGALAIPRNQWRTAAEIQQDRIRYTTARKQTVSRGLEFYRGKRILLWTRKPGLGDMVMNAACCDILRNVYGLDVWYGHRNNPCDGEFPKLFENVPCYPYDPDLKQHPLHDNSPPRGYCGGTDHTGQNLPFDFVMDFRYRIGVEHNTIFQCIHEFGIDSLLAPWHGLRVTNRLPSASSYDVVLCMSTGGWKPVRAYRRVDELSEQLRKRGLSVCDLSQVRIQRELGASKLLALVKRARVFVGTETGPTHLVSGVHRKAVVIQAGIHRSAFWNIYARTHVVEAAWPCGGCHCRVRAHRECSITEGVCIDRFAPSDIADLVAEIG